MKKILCTLAFCLAFSAFGQGTFQFDQQSSTDEGYIGYGYGAAVTGPPTGQSFTPSFSAINFIRLKLDDGASGDSFGASLYLNLHSQSLTGPILGATPTVDLPDGFTGTQNFYFPNTVALTPGTQYYFELVFTFAVNWRMDVESFNYAGGEAYEAGNPLPGGDFWFREGIYTVPEPCGFMLALLGLGAVAVRRHHR